MAQTTMYYTRNHIAKEFNALTKDKKIETLMEALDYMQQYNGRSKFNCIALALGYENYEGEDDTYAKRH